MTKEEIRGVLAPIPTGVSFENVHDTDGSELDVNVTVEPSS